MTLLGIGCHNWPPILMGLGVGHRQMGAGRGEDRAAVEMGRRAATAEAR